MIQSITFTEDWRCFEDGDTVAFLTGVNLLVGDQGSGKSSLIEAVLAGGEAESKRSILNTKVQLSCTACNSKSFNFEKDNPRIQAHFGKNIRAQVGAMFSSHGETNRAILSVLDKMGEGEVIFMDEPDTALSPRSCKMLVQKIITAAERGAQIIAAVHNPYVIGSFDNVFSLEHRLWMSGGDFLDSHLQCDTCGRYPCGCGG